MKQICWPALPPLCCHKFLTAVLSSLIVEATVLNRRVFPKLRLKWTVMISGAVGANSQSLILKSWTSSSIVSSIAKLESRLGDWEQVLIISTKCLAVIFIYLRVLSDQLSSVETGSEYKYGQASVQIPNGSYSLAQSPSLLKGHRSPASARHLAELRTSLWTCTC